MSVLLMLLLPAIMYGQHQLYSENFEGTTNTFTLNDACPGLLINKGNNKWIVNNVYMAGGGYGTTMPEDSTYGGSISYSPHGHYLHIYDSSSGYFNDMYNPNDSSVRFAHMTTGICTKLLATINFGFFYLCKGSPSAYGEVFYSVDGGAWTQVGSPMYNNKYKWQYVSITNPAFANVEDLRFGFLWHNGQAAGKDTSALGIDDVSLYGTYDSIKYPITCTFTTLGSDSCLGGSEYVYLQTTLSDSTCNAVWDVYISNGSGTYPGVYAWYQTISLADSNDISSYWFLQPPSNFNTVGECYRFKLVRTDYPYVTFTDSVCFPFDSCPTAIQQITNSTHTLIEPVPATNYVDMQMSSAEAYQVIILDMTGKQMEKAELQNNHIRINTTYYASGLYLYEVVDRNGNAIDHGKFSVLK